MKIPTLRFSWLEYYSKKNIFLKFYKYCFGTSFFHSRAVAHFLFHNLSFEKSNLVLDIGSGDGNFANWISYHSGCTVIGIDRLSGRIALAKETAQRYHLPNKFICLDLEKNPINFKNKSFDKILIIDTLEHFRNPQRIIHLAGNWLKDNGNLFISTPTINQSRIFLHSYHNTFSYGDDQHFFEGFNIPLLINWLRKAGFGGKIKAKYTFYGLHQFVWEVSEVIRKYKIFYTLFLPLFEIFTSLDHIIRIGKKGNGIILSAQK